MADQMNKGEIIFNYVLSNFKLKYEVGDEKWADTPELKCTQDIFDRAREMDQRGTVRLPASHPVLQPAAHATLRWIRLTRR